MEQGIPEAILADTQLIQDLADVAKDTALLNGVFMRTKEEPGSSEGIPEAIWADTQLIQDLADVAKDTALLNGVFMRTKEEPGSSELVTYAPFTLFPTAMPRGVFEQALALQTHYNLLVDLVSQDTRFLEAALAR
ncbi:hypothetical protein NHX12_012735 [Muraenolepis orangiensis]|uniref:Uncharacterized protein n=1 Tax=Muraenolepis orangiensis TaxID=630683 RepID=A0A9Q0DD12_9TELE|nr:hypothetical protein NHX12_012735 [Muraenolepis orangiensis]